MSIFALLWLVRENRFHPFSFLLTPTHFKPLRGAHTKLKMQWNAQLKKQNLFKLCGYRPTLLLVRSLLRKSVFRAFNRIEKEQKPWLDIRCLIWERYYLKISFNSDFNKAVDRTKDRSEHTMVIISEALCGSDSEIKGHWFLGKNLLFSCVCKDEFVCVCVLVSWGARFLCGWLWLSGESSFEKTRCEERSGNSSNIMLL